jgi:hypothetical protein
MAVIPQKMCQYGALWRANYDSFSIAGLCFVDKIYQTLSQIHGVHIRNCIKDQNI